MGTQDSAVAHQDGVTEGSDGRQDVIQAPAARASTGVVSTRTGRAWVKVLPALLVLAVILVFILQNSQSAKVSFVTASGRLPLAIALLASAALGALLVLALGSIRIIQLRRVIHRSSANRTQAEHPEIGAR
jgi:putative membrane protein